METNSNPDFCPGCDANVIGKTLCKCDSWPCEHPGYIKVPVVVAEFFVQICVEGDTHLPTPALDIKRIKKSVCLNQCRLVAGTCKLFLRGFIRKNIEYTGMPTSNPNDDSCICGKIMDATCFVPFHCCTEVPFIDLENRGPFFKKNRPSKEITYISDSGMCGDFSERDLFSVEHFNEKVTCELEDAIFYEADIERDNCGDFGPDHEQSFQNFTEKCVLCLKIKLLQKQQICLPPVLSPGCQPNCGGWLQGAQMPDDDDDKLENATDFK